MEQEKRQWRPQLTQGECFRGFIFFGLYFFLFPFLFFVIRGGLDTHLGFYLSDAAANTVYYSICAALVVVLFWAFLKHSFDILWGRWRENLFAMGSGAAGCIILTILVGVIPLPVENPILYSYPEQFATAPAAVVTMLVILWPIIEETLFRGLVFGALRKRSRALAWAVSVALFLLFKVWQFAILPDAIDLRYLVLGVQYLPMALAVTWCSDVGGSIWSSIFLHMLISGGGLFLLL